ncbi:MAG: glycosyltransferase family 39 protein [Anaerolineae bacterium]|nr:glycosyltransferase family 39 protein [Anaerolineae bacterium]
MPDTTLTSQRRRLEAALLSAVLLAALVLRLVALRDIPPGPAYDELINADQVERILGGEFVIYSTTDFGREPLYHYLASAVWRLGGRTLVGLRVAAALCGTALVLASYVLARRLFGAPVALIAAAGLAVAFVPLYWSRVGLRIITPTPFIALSAYALWRGLFDAGNTTETQRTQRGISAEEHRNSKNFSVLSVFSVVKKFRWFALGGVSLGLAAYTYIAARVTPFVLLAFVAYLALFHRQAMRGRWRGVVLFFTVAALIALPLVIFLLQHPELEQRTSQLGSILVRLGRGEIAPLLQNAWASMSMFIGAGQKYWIYNIYGRSFFPLPAGVLFYLGLGLAFWRWRQPAYALALLLFWGGMAPDILADGAPSFVHTINILPVAFIFPALALLEGGRRLSGRFPARRRAIIGAGVALMCLYAAVEIDAYFNTWARHPEARTHYASSILSAARYLESRPEIENAALSGPGTDYWNPWEPIALDITLGRPAAARWFNGQTSLLVPGAPGDAWYLVLDAAPLSGEWAAYLDRLETVGPVSDFNGVPQFTVYRLPDPARAAAVQALIETGAGNPAHWMAGADFPSGAERHTLAPPAQVGEAAEFLGYTAYDAAYRPGDTIAFKTFWRAVKPSPSNEALLAFVHVLDSAGAPLAGWDDLDVPAEYWRTGDVFALSHALTLPAGAPPGVYEIAVGLYAPETMHRLPVFDAGQPVSDRVLLLPVTVEP